MIHWPTVQQAEQAWTQWQKDFIKKKKNSDFTEWPSSKSLQTINAGEGVENGMLFTVGGNVNWYSHYGRRYGDSLKH